MCEKYVQKIINKLLYVPVNNQQNINTKNINETKVKLFENILNEQKQIFKLKCAICLNKNCSVDNILPCGLCICENCNFKLEVCPFCDTKICLFAYFEEHAEYINTIKNM